MSISTTASGGFSIPLSAISEIVNSATLTTATNPNTITLDLALGNLFVASTSPTAAITITISNPPAAGRSVAVSLICPQGSTGYFGSTISISGGSVTFKQLGGSAPTVTANQDAIFSYIIRCTAANTYTVYASSSSFN